MTIQLNSGLNLAYAEPVVTDEANRLANEVVKEITRETTPEQFEALCTANPQYRLNFGISCSHETALHCAARQGNVPLINHIYAKALREGNKEEANKLLHCGSYHYGFTPLHTAVHYCNQDAKIAVSRALIDLGANVNNSARHYLIPSGEEAQPQIPIDLTPLSIAAESQDDELVDLLLRENAVATAVDFEKDPWLESKVKARDNRLEQIETFQLAHNVNLDQARKKGVETVKPFTVLPKKITTLILGYLQSMPY